MPSIAGAAASRRQINHLHESHNTNQTTAQLIPPHDARLLHWHSGEFDNDDRNFQIHGETLLYICILFSLILLVTLLLFYARWFFRLRHLSHPVAAPSLIIPIPRPVPPPPASRGLNFAAINSIPIILHQSPAVSDGKIRELECCICLGVFEDGEKVKVLPSCGHRYHCNCVDVWLRDHSNCPLCRLPIGFD